METLDRKKAPAYTLIDKMEPIKSQEKRLSNNIPVYIVNGGTQALVKLEFLFDAGMYYQIMPLQATTVNTMLEEGTSNLSADQIADQVDYYGAYLETSVGQDTASVIVYTLNKHISSVLPIIEQIIKDSAFPQRELDIHLKNKKQLFHLNNQKVANIARKHFSELLFGAKHPYGVMVKEEDFDLINRERLLEFYALFYNSKKCKIIISGKVEETVLGYLENHFGKGEWGGISDVSASVKYTQNNFITTSTSEQYKHQIEMKGVMQSAIRVGKLLFNKTHPHFQELQILNTILGGYFGSRLMMNIREDKGYTYGIGSGIVSLRNGGYFFISTEVGVDVCKNAVDEIFFEINRLRTDFVHEQELELVKNYLLGSFLRSIDGPFAMADRFKGILEYNLGYDYYDKYLETIRNISTPRLKELAIQYLDSNSMTELVVGKK
jgi:zinc protease